MHDLEQSIAVWRKTMMAAPEVGPERLDELENHLREHAGQMVRSGMTETEAFQRAVAQLGSPRTIASEFHKLDLSTWWPVKVVVGTVVTVALLLAIWSGARLEAGRWNLLLAFHVFTVSLGYITVFLTGALGICFICQRSYSDFSPVRLHSLSRVTFNFGCIAVCLTLVGVVLGAIWARVEWGRFWAWDPKETGGLCVVVWLCCILIAHRLRRISAHTLLLMSVLGNVVVSLAWFGGNLLYGLHSYGTSQYWWYLLAAIICHLGVFMAGLAPAGWLRLTGRSGA